MDRSPEILEKNSLLSFLPQSEAAWLPDLTQTLTNNP